MKMKLGLLGSIMLLSIACTVQTVVASPLGLTIYTTKENYSFQKNEPESGIYAGAYVLQDEYIHNDMNTFNEMTGKQHASYFKYVGYGKPFPTEWVEECKAVGAVPHIAWEPNNGLDKVQDDEYLRSFAKAAKESGVPIFLRYASEMNGTWTQYSGKSKLYIEKWRLVHKVMKQEAPNIIMLWTVFTFPENTIDEFYPGDDYVDWVGVNIYNVMYHNDSLKNKADKEDPLKLLDYVYNTYSYKKPIQISEYGVTNYTTTDGKNHIDFAVNKIERIYGNLAKRYPRVKSIFYFDVNNLVNAPAGRRINNYAITENEKILNTYKKVIASETYLTKVVEENKQKGKELLSYNSYLFESGGKTYVDIAFYKNYLGLKATQSNGKVTLSNGSKSYTFSIVRKKIDKGYYGMREDVKGVSLRDVANKFGYKLHFDTDNNTIRVYQ